MRDVQRIYARQGTGSGGLHLKAFVGFTFVFLGVT
jgi:hypothetical protein